jgi:O-antigen/teichoic acid export membrane protein
VQAILAGRPDGFTQVAILGVAMQWFNVIMFIPGNASKVVLPILTDSLTGNDHRGSRSLLGFSVLANALIAIPLAIGLSLFATQILQLYGDSYNDSTFTLRLAVFTAALLACIGPIGTMMSAASRMWLAASTNAAWAALYVGLVFALFGDSAIGVTTALLIAYIFHTIWTILFARVHLLRIANPTEHSATQVPGK